MHAYIFLKELKCCYNIVERHHCDKTVFSHDSKAKHTKPQDPIDAKINPPSLHFLLFGEK